MYSGFAVVHHNEYETAVWGTTSEQAARHSVYTVMLRLADQNIDEVDKPELLSLIEGDAFEEACTFWNEMTEEYFEVRSVEFSTETDKKQSEDLKNVLQTFRDSLGAETEE